MDPMEASIAFVVRVRRSGGDGVTGVVERVRTGEKQRFRGAEALGPLIVEMLERDAAPPDGPQGGKT
jgi:hypothetical protein